MDVEEANKLFDRFVGEIYFGSNMKQVILNKLTPEEVDALKTILIKCQRGRMRLVETRGRDNLS